MTIPLVWNLQACTPEAHWCKCARCKKALRDLGYHCYIRQVLISFPEWRGQ